MPTKTYIGKVLSNGCLLIPKKALKELNLIAGDKIQVILYKGKKQKSPARRHTVGTPEQEELEKAAAFSFSEDTQERLEDLLFKKREGQITQAEARELEALVMEVQIKTIEKAQAMYLLSQQSKRR